MGWTEYEEADATRHVVAGRARVFERPIALAGFTGVGKSTLGKRLAKVLGRPFLDTDEEIELRNGRSVQSYFARGEEDEFRRLESEVVRDLVGRGATIIALGGGALVDSTSRQLVKRRTALVHLHVPWVHLQPHLRELAASRPLLENKTVPEIHRLYLARLHTYQGAALRITVSRVSIDEATRTILDALDLVRGRTTLGPAATLGHRIDVHEWERAWLRLGEKRVGAR